jgi:hypothetical protein
MPQRRRLRRLYCLRSAHGTPAGDDQTARICDASTASVTLAEPRLTTPPSRISRCVAEPARGDQVGAHDDHRHDRERGRERDVAVDADEVVDDVANEARAGSADEQRCDEVAEREREGEDRAGDHPRQRQRQDHGTAIAHGVATARAPGHW